jgi:CheY-like chemotaxis protein
METGLRVLLAEDNSINQKLGIRLLEKNGSRVLLAVNGEQAVELAQREKPDVILMDVQMPECNGLEATQRIREWESTAGGRIPIIALTAHAMTGDRERCLAAGMDDYLPKPLRLDELTAKLQEWSRAGSVKRVDTSVHR